MTKLSATPPVEDTILTRAGLEQKLVISDTSSMLETLFAVDNAYNGSEMDR